jgi:arginine-tRNA-protein transferase
MGYKRNFSALEIFNNGVWRNIDDVEGISNEMHPMNTLPIAEQVANLALP